MNLSSKIMSTLMGHREVDPLMVTKCRLEDWGRFQRKEYPHLGLPRVSVYAKDVFIRSPVVDRSVEPDPIREVSEAIAMLTERRGRILKRFYHHRRTIKQIAGEEGVSRQRMDELYKAAVAEVDRALALSSCAGNCSDP